MVKLPPSMTRIGCQLPPPPRRRLMIGSEGRERTGKTHFWCTSPGPIGAVNFDTGAEGVVDQDQFRGKVIGLINVPIPPVANQKEYLKIYKDSAEKPLFELIKCPDVRTIVIDTGTDFWELMRLAEFGQLNPSGDIKKAYMPLNQLYRSVIYKVFESGKNFVITHKMKQEYENKKTRDGQTWSEPTGKYMRAGFKETGYLIQINLEHMYRFGKTGAVEFGIRIVDCRQNMTIAGLELWGDECNFPKLAEYVYPDSTPEDWE